MRNWNEESPTLSQASSKSDLKRKRNSPSYPMATDTLKKSPAELDLPNDAYQIRNNYLSDSTADRATHAVPFDEAATKKLLRKLDLHLMPFLCIIYL